MKNLKLILTVCIAAWIFTACSKDDTDVIPNKPIVRANAKNIYAYDQDKMAKFSFAKGKIVTDDSWDIAFLGTTILVNGGKNTGKEYTTFTRKKLEEPNRTGKGALAIVSGVFEEIKQIPTEANFKMDADQREALPTGDGNGWYNYSGPPKHEITPITGKVLLIKTHDGHYAKMEILSYYKDADAKTFGYYTFKYVYNPTKGDKSFQKGLSVVTGDPVVSESKIISKRVKNIYAYDQKKIAKFSFAKGKIVTDDSWDIAFLSTAILVNGGKKIGKNYTSFSGKKLKEPNRTAAGALAIISGIFKEIKKIPADAKFKQDDPDTKEALPTGAGNGWYSYSMAKHVIMPIAGKVLLIKTRDGHYVKMEILSYYKDAKPPVKEDPNSGYYTFNYEYNTVKGDKIFSK